MKKDIHNVMEDVLPLLEENGVHAFIWAIHEDTSKCCLAIGSDKKLVTSSFIAELVENEDLFNLISTLVKQAKRIKNKEQKEADSSVKNLLDELKINFNENNRSHRS